MVLPLLPLAAPLIGGLGSAIPGLLGGGGGAATPSVISPTQGDNIGGVTIGSSGGVTRFLSTNPTSGPLLIGAALVVGVIAIVAFTGSRSKK